eukprot:TRINITY_DN9742_c0_g1_i1.p1 TRINITY_DN9742_c0_g1~~TRINITY_DN9742_c0_g1_i1.p1  ORF type:complete len:472 (-),score=102.18 TRINITY_DN9742_c0_g1_i1:96-1511(-)
MIDSSETLREQDRLSRQQSDLYNQNRINTDLLVELKLQVSRMTEDMQDSFQKEAQERTKAIASETGEKIHSKFAALTDRIELLERSFGTIMDASEAKLTTRFEDHLQYSLKEYVTIKNHEEHLVKIQELIQLKSDQRVVDDLAANLEEVRGGHGFLEVDSLLDTIHGCFASHEEKKYTADDGIVQDAHRPQSRSGSLPSKPRSSSFKKEQKPLAAKSTHFQLLSMIVSKIVEFTKNLPKKIGQDEMERIMQQVYENGYRIEALQGIIAELKSVNKDFDKIQLLLPMKVDKMMMKKSLEEKVDKKDYDTFVTKMEDSIKAIHTQFHAPRNLLQLPIPVPASVSSYYAVRSSGPVDEDRMTTDMRSISLGSDVDRFFMPSERDSSILPDVSVQSNSSHNMKRENSRTSTRPKSSTSVSGRASPSFLSTSHIVAADGSVYIGEPEEGEEVLVRIERALAAKDKNARHNRVRKGT